MIEPVPPVIQQRLDPRERVLWWGRPQRGLLFQSSDWLISAFAIFWLCISLAVLSQSLGKNGSPLGAAVSALFVAIGLYLLIGRYLHDSWRRGRTFYAVTPTRAMIVMPSKVNSIDLTRLSQIGLRESWGGRGSIIFGPETYYGSDGESAKGPSFEGIPAAAEVYALIRRVQAGETPAR